MKILVFGNSLVKEDSLALRIMPNLQEEFKEIEFKELDPAENLEDEIEDGKLIILDVAEGIEKVIMLDKIEQLKTNKICSMHDFDLAYNLKILKKIGKLKEIKIIAIPQDMDEKEAVLQTQFILKKCVAQLMHGS